MAESQQYDAAINAFEAALTLSLNLPSTLINLGSALHAVGRLDEAVIASHNRELFEVFCYFNNSQQMQKLRLLGVADTTRVMRDMDDSQVATQIHADAIDILIDIAGHTGHNRLGVFARRPASVQMTWLDYLCTTGLAAMDYRITDAVSDPPGNDAFHAEKLLRLPNTQWCWQADVVAPSVSDSPMIENGTVMFGSFNNAQKLTDITLTLWRSLLETIPDARYCIAPHSESAQNPLQRAN